MYQNESNLNAGSAARQSINRHLGLGSAIESGQPQPISPMGGATAELQASLDVLQKVAEELRMRMSPVLRSCGPDSNTKNGETIQSSSPLREQLDCCTLRVGGIRNLLNDILDRLEV
jgi:hypothetical protein